MPPLSWSQIFRLGLVQTALGAIVFQQAVGATTPLKSLQTQATGYLRLRPSGGLSSVQVGSVTTLGDQRYGQNAILSGTYSTGGGEFSVAGATALDGGVHGVGKKILEEAGEVWLAAEHESDEALAEEISQLLYWTQVLMIARGLGLDDVYRKL